MYCLLKLNLRRKGKKLLPSRNPQPLAVPPEANVCWSLDFMHDALMSGQRFRTFHVSDDFSRECLAIEVDTNLPAARVTRVFDRIAAWRGFPERIRTDNGPELVSVTMADWAETHGVELEFIQPGKPTQNSYVERFNKTYRNEVLDFYLFRTLTEVKDLTENLDQRVQRGKAPRVTWRPDASRVPRSPFTPGNLYFWLALTWGGLHDQNCFR